MTSLVKSFLEEWTDIYIDLRRVRREADLYRAVSKGLSESLGKLKELLRGIRRINIMRFSV
jgi:hypothetical protein